MDDDDEAGVCAARYLLSRIRNSALETSLSELSVLVGDVGWHSWSSSGGRRSWRRCSEEVKLAGSAHQR
jgi:hypothetical protein